MAEGDHLTMLNVYEAFVKVRKVVALQLFNEASKTAGFTFVKSLVKSLIHSCISELIEVNIFGFIFSLQHQKSSQWCQEHFLNYKGLLRALTVREQLRRLLNKFKVPRTSSEGQGSILIKQGVTVLI